MVKKSLLLLFLFVNTCFPQSTPKAVITCQSTGKVGQLIRVTAIKSENVKSYKWGITPDTQEIDVSADNKSFIFTSPEPGKYKIFLAVASPDGGVDFTFSCVTIDAAGEPPAITPDKTNGINKVSPTGEVTLEELIEDIQDKDRKKLADVFHQVVLLIKSGNLDTREDLLDSLETFIRAEEVVDAKFTKKLIETLKDKDLAEIRDYLTTLQGDLEK